MTMVLQRFWRVILTGAILAGLWWWAASVAEAKPASDTSNPPAAFDLRHTRFVDESKPGAPEPSADWITAQLDAEMPEMPAARLALRSTTQAMALHIQGEDLDGRALADLTQLRYCTRTEAGPRPYAVQLQINIDVDPADADRTWQGRLVYTPAHNGAVVQNVWQCWDTLNGRWWATSGPVAAFAPQGSPQLLSEILARFPDVSFHPEHTNVVLKAGGGWEEFLGDAAAVQIQLAGDDSRFMLSRTNAAPERDDAKESGKRSRGLSSWGPPPFSGVHPVHDTHPGAHGLARAQEAQAQDKDKSDKDKPDKEKSDKGKSDEKSRKDDERPAGRSEEVSPPDEREDCRDGGWRELGFSNQGRCISSVQG